MKNASIHLVLFLSVWFLLAKATSFVFHRTLVE